MSDQSKPSGPSTSSDTRSSIPLPALVAGPSLYDLLDGPRTEKSGPEAVLASPTRRRASKKETPTSATFGLRSSSSSKSDVLNLSLANKLRARLSTVGSIEYTQTWKELATPSGRRYWAHTASARTIYVNVSTGALALAACPTPNAHDTHNQGQNREKTESHRFIGVNGASRGADLPEIVKLMAWPKTPAACDGEGGTFDVMKAIRENLNPKAKLRDWALVAAFPTNTSRDAKNVGLPESAARRKEAGHAQPLNEVAQMCGFNTPRATDGSNGALYPDAAKTLGVILDLFFVPTGRRVVLAPEFSLWLMGYPEAWVIAAPGAKDWLEAQAALVLEYSRDRETPSSPSSPPSLS